MSWSAFVQEEPALAAFAAGRLHGRVSYLATTDAGGAPRVHPVTPIVEDGNADEARLFLFMEHTSPKGHDLRRGSRYALHCGVEDTGGGGGEVLLRGSATPADDAATRSAAVAAAPYEPADRYVLSVLDVDEVTVTRYGEHGPERMRWRRGA